MSPLKPVALDYLWIVVNMADKATPLDHFLFLLSELERVADRQDIRWPVHRADIIKARLARVVQKVGQPSPVRKKCATKHN